MAIFRKTGDGLREAGEVTRFGISALGGAAGATRYPAEIARQTATLVRGTTYLIFVLAFFFGFVEANFGYYFLRAAGATDYVGLVSAVGNPRGTTAFIFGYMFAAKVGCGLVSEIGAMKISQEIEAYDVEGVGAMRFVVGTRVAATLLYIPIAAGVALLGTTVGAYVNAVDILHGVPAETFNRFHWGNQALSDQLFALGDIALVALCITLVSCYYGMRASGGPAGVGTAVARSLVVNLVMIHLIVGIAISLFYPAGDLGLPIGG